MSKLSMGGKRLFVARFAAERGSTKGAHARINIWINLIRRRTGDNPADMSLLGIV